MAKKAKKTKFYTLPARELRAGLSTSDGQDIISVKFIGDSVLYDVYTPRPDDPDADGENYCAPEGRIASLGDMIDLAHFPD